MRFLIDENVDVRLIGFLKKLGHEARRVPPGTKNGAVMRLATQEKRVLVTRDDDFTDGLKYPPSKSSGIIHLDIHPPRLKMIGPSVKFFLAAMTAERMAGKLFILGDSGGYEEFA